MEDKANTSVLDSLQILVQLLTLDVVAGKSTTKISYVVFAQSIEALPDFALLYQFNSSTIKWLNTSASKKLT